MSIRDEVRRAPAYHFSALPYRVKLDQNEAAADLPAALRAEAQGRMADAEWHRYPALHAEDLAAAIARRDGWDAAGVVVAPGSNVLIQALVIAAGIGQRVLTVSPTFSVYGQQARLLGVPLREVPLLRPGFGLDVAALDAELAQGPGLFFLPDPAAPTGNRLDDAAVARLLAAAADHDWTVVIDEAYWAFDGRDRLDAVRDLPGRIALRTLSKADGLAGVRLGYALTDPDTAEQLTKVLLPFAVSTLQTAVAGAVLDGGDAVRDERVRATVRERDHLERELSRLPGVEVHPSVTNFLLFRVADPAAVHEELGRRGVLVRRQDHLPGLDGCLRVTVGTREDHDAFLDALRQALPTMAGR